MRHEESPKYTDRYRNTYIIQITLATVLSIRYSFLKLKTKLSLNKVHYTSVMAIPMLYCTFTSAHLGRSWIHHEYLLSTHKQVILISPRRLFTPVRRIYGAKFTDQRRNLPGCEKSPILQYTDVNARTQYKCRTFLFQTSSVRSRPGTDWRQAEAPG